MVRIECSQLKLCGPALGELGRASEPRHGCARDLVLVSRVSIFRAYPYVAKY